MKPHRFCQVAQKDINGKCPITNGNPGGNCKSACTALENPPTCPYSKAPGKVCWYRARPEKERNFCLDVECPGAGGEVT